MRYPDRDAPPGLMIHISGFQAQRRPVDQPSGYGGSAEVPQGNCPDPPCSPGSVDCSEAPEIREPDTKNWFLESVQG